MKIALGPEEFNDAIKCWLVSLGFEIKDYTIDVNIIAGRKFSSTAEVTLTALDSEPEVIPVIELGDLMPKTTEEIVEEATSSKPLFLG